MRIELIQCADGIQTSVNEYVSPLEQLFLNTLMRNTSGIVSMKILFAGDEVQFPIASVPETYTDFVCTL